MTPRRLVVGGAAIALAMVAWLHMQHFDPVKDDAPPTVFVQEPQQHPLRSRAEVSDANVVSAQVSQAVHPVLPSSSPLSWPWIVTGVVSEDMVFPPAGVVAKAGPHNNPAVLPPSRPNARCVMQRIGTGGMGLQSLSDIERRANHPNSFGVIEDLLAFTGLTREELFKRLRREDQFHFEGEHAWWDPTSRTELTWYYCTSVSYLFGNSIHEAKLPTLGLKPEPGHERREVWSEFGL
jgi:hypothetical protein